jgi:drug/metabolite transporter (DMT)-like permease
MIRQHIKLHIIVLILGFTAVLGKLISVPAIPLVWYRMIIAAVSLLILMLFSRKSPALPVKVIMRLALTGLVVAAHWLAFFHAIKVSNIAVTLSCLSATTLFTAFIEPLSQKRRISWIEVFIGAVIIAALYMIYQFETRYVSGILFALLAALLACLFSVMNKNIATRYDTRAIAFWEMLSGFIAISIFILCTTPLSQINLAISLTDLIWLIILGTICTALAFAETIAVMKKLSAYVVVLVINLEPVYGIILAYFIFGESEHMTTGFYLGTLILLASVFSYPILKRKLQK